MAAGLCEGGNEPAGSLKASKHLGGMEVEPHAFHDLGTRMRWCGRHHALTAFYPQERPGTQFYRRLSEPRGRSESLATRKDPVTTWDRTPDLPVRSQLLYQLSYPAAIKELVLRVQFKVCHGSLYDVMWLADEPREFNLPTLPQRRITYVPEKLPSKYCVHSGEFLPIRTLTPVVAGMNCLETRTGIGTTRSWRLKPPLIISKGLLRATMSQTAPQGCVHIAQKTGTNFRTRNRKTPRRSCAECVCERTICRADFDLRARSLDVDNYYTNT
ncbi:hypothetical protein ANN_09037 [Periplaneta americana]|uniref:Uncharacterized protein n=1 Tax=Periplaneta americana TaxID=6978 RepID=A0ABQ8TMG7_PERAM|nr:hypothetical protein ANN_09037 [Periplaneta americana]